MRNFIPLVLVLLILCIQSSFGNNIPPGNPYADDSLKVIEKVYLHIDRDFYSPGDNIWFKAYLIDATDNLLTNHSNNLHVELISPDSRIIDSRVVRITGGLGNGDFSLGEDLMSGQYRLRAYTNYMRNFSDELFFNKDIIIVKLSDAGKVFSDSVRYVKNRTEISFFPEGGSLVDNVESVVAFKAVNAAGESCEVTGAVYSSSGDSITSFKSTHKGMGVFSITPVPGLNYYALTRDPGGNEVRFDLPRSFSSGVVLNVSKNQPNELTLTIKTNMETLPLVLNNDLLLSVSARNIALKTITFRMKTLSGSLILKTDDLPDGIVMLTLTGPGSLPLCERLVYLQNKPAPEVTLQTDKSLYTRRDSVSVKISVPEDSGIVQSAFLSLSATDVNSLNYPANPPTICSWFLLESDVRGLVEEPSYYFDTSNPDRLKDLDQLLLTQGWRDFEWKYKTIEYLPENGFTISGRARKKLADVPIQNSTVTLAIFKGGKPIIDVLPMDSEGRFISEAIDFTGEGRLVATVTGDKDELKGWLLLDSTRYSPAQCKNIAQRNAVIQNDYQTVSDTITEVRESLRSKRFHDFIQYTEISNTIKKKYKLSDTIALGEVNIIAKRVDWTETPKSRSRHYLRGEPNREIVITPQLEIYRNVHQLLTQQFIIVPRNFPGARRMRTPLYMIDGVQATLSDVKALPISLVERVDIINDPASYAALSTPVVLESVDSTGAPVTYLGYPDGAISIILKDINDPSFYKTFYHSVTTKFSGYNEPRIFYSPDHHTSLQSDYKPDLRTTLFWEPNIIRETKNDLYLKFFNADNSSTIRVTVEGITSDGIPVTARTQYIVQ